MPAPSPSPALSVPPYPWYRPDPHHSVGHVLTLAYCEYRGHPTGHDRGRVRAPTCPSHALDLFQHVPAPFGLQPSRRVFRRLSIVSDLRQGPDLGPFATDHNRNGHGRDNRRLCHLRPGGNSHLCPGAGHRVHRVDVTCPGPFDL